MTLDIAHQLGLQVGDTLPVSVMASTQQDPFALEETGESRTWTVAGIVNQEEDYEGRIWVSQQEALSQAPLFGYALGRAVLNNSQALAAVEQLEAMAPDGVEITLYDQGYATAAQPLQAMEATAQGVTFASLVGVLAVLCLFAFLFVGRQQQAVDVMVSLGTPKGKVRLWLLSGVTLVAGIAVLLGMAASAGTMQLLIGLALQGAQALYAADRRYSNGALGISREAELPQQAPLWPALVAGVVVFLLALVLSGFLGFLAVTAQGWDGERERLYHDTTISGQFTSLNGRQYTGLALKDPWHLWDSGLLSSLQVYQSIHYWMPGEMPEFSKWRGQPAVWLAAAGFALCYLAGCALAIRAVGRTKIFTLLTHAD